MHATVNSITLNKYEFYETKSYSQYNRRCIDGSITGCNKCVGYCRYNEHPGFLTEKQRKQHNCIGKQCFHYIAKPEKKRIANKSINLSLSIQAFANKIMSDDECVRVIRVENTEANRYKAFYITITNECEIDRYTQQIENEMEIEIAFVKLDYDFDTCVALL